MSRYISIFSLSIALSGLLWACSTEKNAWLNRSYHNTTARYNGYFNANELMKEALLNYELSYEDNYNELLPIYIYADEKDSKALYPAMDTAIKKCATVINKHSMPEKKVGKNAKTEWCRWIDDNWLIVGKSNFHKREFDKSLEMFEFIMDQYEKEEIAHTAKLWSAKTRIETEDYTGAAKYLAQLEEEVENAIKEAEEEKSRKKSQSNSKKRSKSKSKKGSRSKSRSKNSKSKDEESAMVSAIPEELYEKVYIVSADLHIRREEWAKAIDNLNIAIEMKPKKKLTTRLYFILAQLYQKTGYAELANQAYTQVIKRNPTYEMTFYSKINRALSGGGNKEELKKELLAMARDDKNVDYLDQIYYALGDLELQENNKEEGIAYLLKSAETSKKNVHQKTKTYLRLANIYFDDKNYENAQAYYDSTASVVVKEHPEYDMIKAKNKSLTALIGHIKEVELQDSLQRLGRLTEYEQEQVVAQIIEDLKAEEERIREEALQEQIAEALAEANSAGKGGKFWVYSPQLKSTGFADFKRKWGDRSREDNWRRSNKATVLEDAYVGGNSEEKDSVNSSLAERYNPETYLKNIPRTPQEYEISDVLIIDALYGEGVIYKDELRDYTEATKSFKELVNRFPNVSRTPAALYQLFRIGEMSSAVKPELYKNRLLEEFPNSDHAQLILDPKFLEKRKKQQDRLKNEYKEYYNEYKRGNYNAIILKANEVATDTTIGEYQCLYLYLKALAIGRISPPSVDPTAFEAALSDVIRTCKGSVVAAEAQKTMDLMKNQTTVEEASEGNSTYIYQAAEAHFFVYIHDKTKGSINPIKMGISNFNVNSFSTKGLITSSNFLNAENQLVMVRSFENKDDAMDYFIAFKVNKTSLKNYNSGENFFVISGKNYASLLIEKDDVNYRKFFDENYMD